MRPLPEGWSTPTTVDDTIVADGVTLHRAGVASTAPHGEEITGSAAGPRADVVKRGWFELLERVATLEALRAPRRWLVHSRSGDPAGSRDHAALFPESDDPARWRFARSSGVALHASWGAACERARWELVERDRVTRSWYGEIDPRSLAFDVKETPLGGCLSYVWEAYLFDDDGSASWSAGVHAVGVVGFPRRAELPLVVGWGARGDVQAALGAAIVEASQMLAFLWGEALPDTPPPPGPTAMHHLEALIAPGTATRLRAWLDGEHRRWSSSKRVRATPASIPEGPRGDAPVTFVDLTPAWLGGGLRVAKAVCDAAMPLAFGEAPWAAHLPRELRCHPIA